MACVSSLVFAALVASLSFWTSRADTVAFLDGSSSSYLKQSVPAHLSADGYAVLQSVLSHEAPPLHVSDALATEVDQFVVPDVFRRPAATWNVVLFGATPTELFANEEATNAEGSAAKFVDVADGVPVSVHRSPTKRVFQSCGSTCLAESLREGSERLVGTYDRQGSADLAGVLSLKHCSAEPLPLQHGALSLWAAELGALWRDVLTMPRLSDRPMRYDSTLTGLYLVRQNYGAASEEFRFASCYTAATLKKLHEIVGDEVNGQLLMSILMQKDVGTSEADAVVEKAMLTHGRNLLEILKYADNDPTTTVQEKTKRFATNSVAYVIFLLLLFSSLGSLYAMVNMDFTKDTLLYSQAKID